MVGVLLWWQPRLLHKSGAGLDWIENRRFLGRTRGSIRQGPLYSLLLLSTFSSFTGYAGSRAAYILMSSLLCFFFFLFSLSVVDLHGN